MSFSSRFAGIGISILSGLALMGYAPTAHAANACMALQTGSVFSTGGDACQLIASGTSIDAIYIFTGGSLSSAFALPGHGDIFTDSVGTAIGTVVPGIATTPGQLLGFTLAPQGSTETFTAGVPASDGQYNAAYRSSVEPGSLNIFGFEPGNAAYDYMDTHGGLAAWTLVGWDDTISGDKDFNDVVVAVRGAATLVPEAGTAASLLAGLLMLMARRGLSPASRRAAARP